MAVEGKIEVRPMMYVALTYDHRIVDGREAVLFLRKVRALRLCMLLSTGKVDLVPSSFSFAFRIALCRSRTAWRTPLAWCSTCRRAIATALAIDPNGTRFIVSQVGLGLEV